MQPTLIILEASIENILKDFKGGLHLGTPILQWPLSGGVAGKKDVVLSTHVHTLNVRLCTHIALCSMDWKFKHSKGKR